MTNSILVMLISLMVQGKAAGQTTTAAAGSLKALFVDLAVKASTAGGGNIPPLAIEAVTSFGELATVEIATAPRATSTGGLTYSYDQSLGAWKASSSTLGPLFSERSLTTGKGKVAVGFNWLHSSYNTYGGQDMENGEFRPIINIRSPLGPPSYTVLKMHISSTTVETFASAGLTNDLDVGIEVPWTRVSIDADYATFSSANVDLSNAFLGGHITIPAVSAAGAGDISLFAKYHAWHHNEGGLAGEVAVRFPTGDADNFRGLGVTRTLFSAIWSGGGRVSPHANLGYEIWWEGAPVAPLRNVFAKNQIAYSAGVEFEAHPRVTAILDVVGRRQLNAGQLGYVTVPIPGQGTLDVLGGIDQGLNVISIAPGVKWNLWRNAVVTGSVLGSLANHGLRAYITPVMGLDWTF